MYSNTCKNIILNKYSYKYMKTIGNMQNKMDFYDYYNEIEYKHDYEKK